MPSHAPPPPTYFSPSREILDGENENVTISRTRAHRAFSLADKPPPLHAVTRWRHKSAPPADAPIASNRALPSLVRPQRELARGRPGARYPMSPSPRFGFTFFLPAKGAVAPPVTALSLIIPAHCRLPAPGPLKSPSKNSAARRSRPRERAVAPSGQAQLLSRSDLHQGLSRGGSNSASASVF